MVVLPKLNVAAVVVDFGTEEAADEAPKENTAGAAVSLVVGAVLVAPNEKTGAGADVVLAAAVEVTFAVAPTENEAFEAVTLVAVVEGVPLPAPKVKVGAAVAGPGAAADEATPNWNGVADAAGVGLAADAPKANTGAAVLVMVAVADDIGLVVPELEPKEKAGFCTSAVAGLAPNVKAGVVAAKVAVAVYAGGSAVSAEVVTTAAGVVPEVLFFPNSNIGGLEAVSGDFALPDVFSGAVDPVSELMLGEVNPN